MKFLKNLFKSKIKALEPTDCDYTLRIINDFDEKNNKSLINVFGITKERALELGTHLEEISNKGMYMHDALLEGSKIVKHQNELMYISFLIGYQYAHDESKQRVLGVLNQLKP